MAAGKIKRVGVGILACFTLITLTSYVFDARRRARATECVNATSHNGLYRAQSCLTGTRGNVGDYVGRLYEARTGNLVAETTFDSMDGGVPDFMDDDHAVLFDGGGDSGLIYIPPSLLDRLRAKIP
ncbi:hypothetical protein ACFSHT_00875 [Paraburkholderia silviterrae]|uniref:Uncharacterized protein n=1 Tax=Paraburkholderia silviterrae TaxID=2528715 RepID=A0A4R5MH04_9BURK|nr:hypothetical protein [Paraburkholderia silviterrae]TDG26166.1 hypothetical protein EYW47_02085 [Paraburkholderia silviterrae]